MDLIFSTANTDLFKIGCSVVDQWKRDFADDKIISVLDHPVVAFDGTDQVGLFEVSLDYCSSIMWIDSLWIHPSKRREGFGSGIMNYLTDTCQYKLIKLYAANNSDPFYLKHGFTCSVGNYYERKITND